MSSDDDKTDRGGGLVSLGGRVRRASNPLTATGSGRGGLRGVIGAFARHPNAANLVMALMILFGLYGLANLNTQFFPDVETNSVNISVSWSGASAEDVEANILSVVEPEVRFISGVTDMLSYAREGSGSIRLEFSDSTDMLDARADVEQAMSGLTLLPEGADTPEITTSDFFDRVGRIAVSGPFSEAVLKTYARDLRDRLVEGGVDRVDFSGMRDTQYEVTINAATLRRLDLTVEDIARRISQNSRDLPSGNLDGELERQVRTLGDVDTIEALGHVVIRGQASGERIELRDVARIERSYDRSQAQGFLGEDRAIRLDVYRSAGSDVLDVADALVATVEQAQAEFPQSLTITIFDLRSTAVQQRIQLLVTNGLTGLAVVVGILFVFLNMRIAFWVAVGIPTAMMATLGLMYLFGESINMMSLFALIMTLGIIVDDAIVVGEHTATRLDMGDGPYEAAENGATRMMLPVMAAMLTTTAAFGPILLIGSTIGQIIGVLPVIVVAVLIASLIEVFFVLPGHLAHSLGATRKIGISWMRVILTALLIAAPIVVVVFQPILVDQLGLGELASAVRAHPLFAVSDPAADIASRLQRFALPASIAAASFIVAMLIELLRLRMLTKRRGSRSVPAVHQQSWFRHHFDRSFNWLRDHPFRAIVRGAVRWRYVTLAVCVACLIVTVGVIRGNHVGFVFFPSPEAENITASITFAPGVSEPVALRTLQEVDAALRLADARLTEGIDDEDTLIRASYASYGTAGRNRGDNFASIDVELTSSEVRSVRTPELVRAWRQQLPQLAGIERVAIFERRGGPPGRDLDIRLQATSAATLKDAAQDLQTVLSSFPGVSGVDDDLPYGKPELVIALTERGEALGFTLESIGAQVRDAVGGRVARDLPAVDEEITILVRQDLGEGGSGALRRLEVRTPSGVYVPLMEVVTLTDRQGFAVIQRRDGRTTISVTADVDPEVTNNGEIETALREGELQRIAAQYGVSFQFSGRAEERAEAFADLRLGGVVALGLMYIILAWIFASYWRPIAVMMIIPFGAVGAIFGHWVMGFQLTILSLIGLLGLAGILVNNSIILVSRFDDRLKEGLSVTDAAVQATQDRFRAILLTSLTTVGGLSPLLFETSLQAQFLLPMAITITFGLATATLFVMVLVPSLLKIGDDVGQSIRAVFGRKVLDNLPAPAE
ncbi:MAG: efflux RND transporter permease subunit [Pseudomonadota bacterium]